MYVCMYVCRGYGCIHIGYVNVCLYEYLCKYVYTYSMYCMYTGYMNVLMYVPLLVCGRILYVHFIQHKIVQSEA